MGSNTLTLNSSGCKISRGTPLTLTIPFPGLIVAAATDVFFLPNVYTISFFDAILILGY